MVELLNFSSVSPVPSFFHPEQTRKLNRWGFKHFTLPADASEASRDMAVYTHPRFRRDDYATVCEMDGGHRSRTRGNSNPDLTSVDFAMSMASNGGQGVGMANSSFHSTGSLSALGSAGSHGLPAHPPLHHHSLPVPLAHVHRQSTIDVAVSAAQEMSLELQLQDTNRMLMQLNELQNQYASSTGQQRQQQVQDGGGIDQSGHQEQERRWEQMMQQQQQTNATGGAALGPAEEKIDFSSIDAGAMNSNSSAAMQHQTSADGAAPGGKKPSRDDPDALAAFMGLRRTSLGYMPYLPTSSRRESKMSSVSDNSNQLGDPFSEFPDHSCPVTNPVDDMRDVRFHRQSMSGSSTASQQQRSVSRGPSPPLSSLVPNTTTPGDTFEVDIMAQVKNEFDRAASNASSTGEEKKAVV